MSDEAVERPLWILIANGSEGRVVAVTRELDDPLLVHEFAHPAARQKDIELITGERGRTAPRGGPNGGDAPGHRSAMAPGTDRHDHEVKRFANEVGEWLRTALTRNGYDDLVVVAPPKMLGMLRSEMKTPVPESVLVEIDKDYTNLRVEEVLEQLRPQVRPSD